MWGAATCFSRAEPANCRPARSCTLWGPAIMGFPSLVGSLPPSKTCQMNPLPLKKGSLKTDCRWGHARIPWLQWWFHMVSHIQFHGGWLCHADSECFVFSSSTFGVFQCSLKTRGSKRSPQPCPFANKMINQIDKGLVESSGRMLLGRPMELQHR